VTQPSAPVPAPPVPARSPEVPKADGRTLTAAQLQVQISTAPRATLHAAINTALQTVPESTLRMCVSAMVGGVLRGNEHPLRNTTDPKRHRATYNIEYPLNDYVFSRSEDLENLPKAAEGDLLRTVNSKRLTFAFSNKTLNGIVFRKCNFHDRKGDGFAQIAHLTFRSCVFESCFMGTAEYSHARFIDCEFKRCDFENAKFRDCVFDRCKFTECTAFNVHFSNTQIEPSSFMTGLVSPVYNYDAARNAIPSIQRTWLEIRFRVAGQLYKSNSEVHDSVLSDMALYELKRAEHEFLTDLWHTGEPPPPLSNQTISSLGTASSTASELASKRKSTIGWFLCIARRANLYLTEGGTSFRKLFCMSLVMNLVVYPAAIILFPLKYQGTPCYQGGFSLAGVVDYYPKAIPRSISLFFGFGFGNFEPATGWASVVLVLAALFGFFWYALLIPVFLRKIYR